MNVYGSSIIFGLTTPNNSVCCATTSSTVTLTLYWKAFKYQCHVNPTQSNTYYSCNTSNITTTSQCHSSSDITDSITYALQIDNDDHDTVGIDRVIIKTMENGMDADILYDIDYFCFFNSSAMHATLNIFPGYKTIDHCDQNGWDIIPIEYDQTFPYILISFITSNESSVYIMNDTAHCNSCSNIINTPYYGGRDGVRYSAINQGRITGVTSWGIRSNVTSYPNSLGCIQWTNNKPETESNQTINGGKGNSLEMCTPFILDTDDYIIGYNVIYDEYVYGVTFYTLKYKTYPCIDSVVALNLSKYQDSGIIIYNNSYLSGFYWYLGDGFDSIAFQFTPFNATDICSYKYILIESMKSWEDGNSFCTEQYNSSLATIVTDSDFQIANYIRNGIHQHSWKQQQNVWIGLTDRLSEGIWKWIDGTSCHYIESGLCVNDIHWGLIKPNNTNYNGRCGLLEDGYYNDAQCEEKNMFLCNKKQNMLTPEIITTSNPTSNITPTATLNHNDNLLDVTIYSRGYNHDEINNEFYSFITINNRHNVISPTKRGFNVVILDELNGSIVGKYKSDTFNYSYSIQRDMELANYLNSVKSNDIIIITVFDTVTMEDGRNPNYTLSVLQLFGCNISSIGFRESFIFIGTANNNTNHPLWTYCESDPHSNSNGRILSDGAILKSFQIPLSMEKISTSLDSKQNITTDDTEPIIVERDDESLSVTKLIIEISIILICCIISLSTGIVIGCCYYKRKIRINMQKREENEMNARELEQKDNIKSLKFPKMFSITPPGLAEDDSLAVTPRNADQLTTTPSGMTTFSSIPLDKRVTVATNFTLNIEGFQKEPKLGIIDFVLNVSDGTIINKPIKLEEIMDIQSDPSLNDDDDNVEHKHSDDSDDIDDDKKQNTHIEIKRIDANNNKLNLKGIDSELSDGMYANHNEYIDDKTYTLRTTPYSFKLKAPQNEQTSTPNTITAEFEDSGDV